MATKVDEIIDVKADIAIYQSNEYNTVFRQASTNLLVVAGILLAFATQFAGYANETDITTKIIVTIMIASLTLSLAFGVLQQLLEAEFFRRAAFRNATKIKQIRDLKITNANIAEGVFLQPLDLKKAAVTRWPTIVQLSLLGIALTAIVGVSIHLLFK